MKAEGRRQKAEGRTVSCLLSWSLVFFVLPSAFCLLPSSAYADNSLTVAPRTLQLTDLATITVSVEGSFASIEVVKVPLENLAIVGEPSVSSEFSWISGEFVRRKTFRYRARPLAPGPARVGPLVIDTSDGQRDTLPAIALQVMPDRIAETNDPDVLLRELVATGRPPLFLVAEADKRQAWTGEQIVVTWYLYNGATVENWQILNVPKLHDFWIEEIDTRPSETERVFVGDRMLHRVALRRTALYPLRGGALQIGGMTLEAAVMERMRRGPFGRFEGNLVETTFTSAPLAIAVKPLPPGPPVDAIGELALSCSVPKQERGGPVVVEATLAGTGNLRSASPPRFVAAVAGNVQVEGGVTAVSREGGTISMSRKWRYLVFPSSAGGSEGGPPVRLADGTSALPLEIPPMTMSVFSPSTGARRELRCESATVWNAEFHSAGPPASSRRRQDAGGPANWKPAFLIALIAILFAALVVPRARRELALRREVRDIMTSGDIRARIDARVDGARLLTEASDRGDAWRALRSLLDAVERDRDIAAGAEDEIARRVRELLTIAK
ncbi:MAG TPA: BatD family protein [Thermoanaerobaculia bacterium]|nr:BatD family protein [Thermoanaerobaculia bacterium]